MSFNYDLFVIGAGPGGLAAAERAANYGARVAIAEHDRVGGTCVIHGCIPEKMMTFAAQFSRLFKNADEYGWGTVSKHFDWGQFMAARNRDINHLSQVHQRHLQEAGVELLQGHARFLNEYTLDIDGRNCTAEKILVAVGGQAVKPAGVPGIEHAITTRELLNLEQQPEHLAILGSNHIAVKLAGIMNGLISKVTLVVPEEQILPDCDQDIQTTVHEGMTRQGIRICRNSRVEKIEPAQNCLNLTISGDDAPTTVETVVFITGRMPNLEGLGLENTDVEVKKGEIVVDDYSRTTQSNVFAVGDCTPRPHWTPVAIASGRAFADTEFGNNPRTVSYENIPYVIASQPEAATIGLTEAQARERLGETVHCYCNRFQPLFNLIGESSQEAMLKLVVDSNTNRILGAHMVGNCAAEVIQMFAPAIRAGVTKADFDSAIGIHPSISEEFFTLQ